MTGEKIDNGLRDKFYYSQSAEMSLVDLDGQTILHIQCYLKVILSKF
jgi:hypothetical protein